MRKIYSPYQLICFLCFCLIGFSSGAQIFDTTFGAGAGLNDAVGDMVLQADGKIIIGGKFTSYNGQTVHRIARLNPYGTLDQSFNVGTGANNEISTLALQSDGKILVGGNFTFFNQVGINRVVRLNQDGSLDTGFSVTRNPDADLYHRGANSAVYKITQVPNGKIIVAGCFNRFDGSSTARGARLNSDGSVDPTFTTFFSEFALGCVMQADGKILVFFKVRVNCIG